MHKEVLEMKRVVILIVIAIIAAVALAACGGGNKGDSAKFDRTFTDEEQAVLDSQSIDAAALAAFDGKEGRPAYVAVDGVVYDVSAEWKDGEHHGEKAGTDVTEAFLNSPHSGKVIQDLPVVGRYEG
jgi:predicted heme/steroid binding protein